MISALLNVIVVPPSLALHAFGIGAGAEVITASRTFIASASCAVLRGDAAVARHRA